MPARPIGAAPATVRAVRETAAAAAARVTGATTRRHAGAQVGGTVSVRYQVEVDGHVGDCTVTRSSGNAELDELTCALIHQRFRFAPSRDAGGRPIRSIVAESHSWLYDQAADALHHD